MRPNRQETKGPYRSGGEDGCWRSRADALTIQSRSVGNRGRSRHWSVPTRRRGCNAEALGYGESPARARFFEGFPRVDAAYLAPTWSAAIRYPFDRDRAEFQRGGAARR